MLINIDRYEISREIGRGSMGIVYSGYDPIINRHVAIKILRLDFLREDEKTGFIERFKREAQSAGKLSHQNIVTIFDLGEDKESKNLYISMEYVKGLNLKDYIQKNQPIEHNDVLSILSQIAEGLDYAHKQGIIHRDIKPANILINQSGTAKITDFGIAKVAGTDFTQTGRCLGTPSYMSPEQVCGKIIAHRSDIFSAGALAWELFTGEKAFEGDSITSIAYKILNEHPKMPVSCSLSSNSGLISALNKCLHKEPSERYDSVSDFILDIRNALQNEAFKEPARDATLTVNISKKSKEDYEQLLLKLRKRYVEGEIGKITYKEMQKDIELDYARDRYIHGEIGEETYSNTKRAIEEEFQKAAADIKENKETTGLQLDSKKVKADPIPPVMPSQEKTDKYDIDPNVNNKISRNKLTTGILSAILVILFGYFLYNLEFSRPDKDHWNIIYEPAVLPEPETAVDLHQEEYSARKQKAESLVNNLRESLKKDRILLAIDYLNELKEIDPANKNLTFLEEAIRKRQIEIDEEKAKQHELAQQEKEIRQQELLLLEISDLLKKAELAIKSKDYYTARDLSEEILEIDASHHRASRIFIIADEEIEKIEILENKRKRAGERREFEVKGVKFGVRYCPPGTFLMGSPETEEGRLEDEVQREVALTRGFWIMETEVNQELWEAVMILHVSRFRGKNLPLTDLGWNYAVMFCNKLSSITGKTWTLPTEAEWEYACRAGTDTPFSFGDKLDFSLANFDGNHPYGGGRKGIYLGRPAPVGSYVPNQWGIYDMHGNVWEWCQDFYADYDMDDLIDPSGSAKGTYRVIRGGGWYDRGRFLRSATRRYETKPRFGSFIVGFRAVLREDID